MGRFVEECISEEAGWAVDRLKARLEGLKSWPVPHLLSVPSMPASEDTVLNEGEWLPSGNSQSSRHGQQ